jgi:hypothetical protein
VLLGKAESRSAPSKKNPNLRASGGTGDSNSGENKSEVDPNYSSYVPANKDIFLENVNPDVTRAGEVILVCLA